MKQRAENRVILMTLQQGRCVYSFEPPHRGRFKRVPTINVLSINFINTWGLQGYLNYRIFDTYTAKHFFSRMSSYFPNRWPLSYPNTTKNLITHKAPTAQKNLNTKALNNKNHHT